MTILRLELRKKVETRVLSPSLSRIGTEAQVQPAQVKLITSGGREPGRCPGVESCTELWLWPNGPAKKPSSPLRKRILSCHRFSAAFPFYQYHYSMGCLCSKHTLHSYRSVLTDGCEGEEAENYGMLSIRVKWLSQDPQKGQESALCSFHKKQVIASFMLAQLRQLSCQGSSFPSSNC